MQIPRHALAAFRGCGRLGMTRGKMGVTAAKFRKMALSFPETEEQEHMGHPDFRVRGKVFATLGYPDEQWGMVKLTPELQDGFMRESDAFVPAKGAWGRKGSTTVRLSAVEEQVLKRALEAAWRSAGSKPILKKR